MTKIVSGIVCCKKMQWCTSPKKRRLVLCCLGHVHIGHNAIFECWHFYGKSRKVDNYQWNWVNQKKNQKTSSVEDAIIGVKQYPVKKVYVLKGTKSNECWCFYYYHPTIQRCQLDAIQDQMVHIHPMCTMVWSCWGPRNSMLRSQLYHIKRLLLLALVGSLPLLSVSPKPITQAWFVKTMTSSVSLALMELSDFNAEEQCI